MYNLGFYYFWALWNWNASSTHKSHIVLLLLSSVQLLSRVQLFVTPWTAACQASLSITNSRSLFKLISTESVMPSNHLILCRPLLLPPSIFPSISVFKWVSSSHQVAKVLEFQLQHQSFQWILRTDLLSVQGTLKSLLQHHSSKASIPRHSAFFIVQFSHPYMTTGKTIAFNRQIFVGRVMSLLFNMPPRLVITFLPRSKRLLISWLQSPSAVIFEPQNTKSLIVSIVSPSICQWSDETRCHDLSFLNVELSGNVFTLLFHYHQEAL